MTFGGELFLLDAGVGPILLCSQRVVCDEATVRGEDGNGIPPMLDTHHNKGPVVAALDLSRRVELCNPSP